MLPLAARLVEESGRIDRVWPGFWTTPRSYLVYDDEWTFLFTTDPPLDGFVPLEGDDVPPSVAGNVYVKWGPPTFEHLRRGIRRGGPVPAAVAPLVRPGASAVPVSQEEVIFHETFHFWQRARWPDLHRPPQDCTPQRYEGLAVPPPPGSPGSVVPELHRLEEAVLAETDEDRVGAARAYLQARRRRLAGLEAPLAAIEPRQERREGSAHFVGRFAALAISGRAGLLRDSVASELRRHRRAIEMDSLTAEEEATRRFYSTGAAMALLLESLDGEGWRDALARGAFPDRMLAGRLGMDAYLRWSEDAYAGRPCREDDRSGPERLPR